MKGINEPQTVKPKGSTKDRLIEVGQALLWKNGYNDTGIQEVLKRSGVPKGSFYHHFSSKEDFGLQVLDDFATKSRQTLDRHLESTDLPALARLEGFFRQQRNDFEARGCRDGCLIGNFGQELAETQEAFRARVQQHMEAMIQRITFCLKQAQDQGSCPYDPTDYAEVLFSAWHGSLLRMKVQQSIEPVDAFLRIHFQTQQ